MTDDTLEVRGREPVFPRLEPRVAALDEPPRHLLRDGSLRPERGVELRVG